MKISRMILSAVCCTAFTFAAVDTRLADAARRGDREAVRSLLKQKADVNTAPGDGATALHWAAYQDDLEMAKLLLAAGANVKATTRVGEITPLFMACTNGNAAMIEAFLKAGADANSIKANGTTALMIAASSGNVDAVKVLLDHGADIKAKENVRAQTALMFAAALNRVDVVRLLASRGAEINAASTVHKMERVRFDQDGNVVEDRPAGRGATPATATEASATQPKADEAPRAELDAFAHSLGLSDALYRIPSAAGGRRGGAPRAGDVAARGPRKVGADFMGGMTALLYAAREGHLATARTLVEAGADVNLVSGGDKISPMVEAIMNGHYDLAKYLLDHAADPNLVAVTGLTALYATIDAQWAPNAWYPQPNVQQEHITYLDLMKALLEKGANPDARVGEKLWFRSFTNDYTWVDPAGATSFWRAAQSSDIAAMRLLIAHGADPKLTANGGETPLHAAAGIGWAANWSVNAPYPYLDAVKYCVELGNDVNAVDNRGYTPLHGAAYLGNNDMVNFLVQKGARADVKSRAGDSAADMANGPTRFGQPHPETVALLEKLGSPNSHNCRSDQCVVAARAQIYDRRTPADFTQGAELDALAHSLGFSGTEYRVDMNAGALPARGAGRTELPGVKPLIPDPPPTPAATPKKTGERQ
jgi:ankyrin repeat protein